MNGPSSHSLQTLSPDVLIVESPHSLYEKENELEPIIKSGIVSDTTMVLDGRSGNQQVSNSCVGNLENKLFGETLDSMATSESNEGQHTGNAGIPLEQAQLLINTSDLLSFGGLVRENFTDNREPSSEDQLLDAVNMMNTELFQLQQPVSDSSPLSSPGLLSPVSHVTSPESTFAETANTQMSLIEQSDALNLDSDSCLWEITTSSSTDAFSVATDVCSSPNGSRKVMKSTAQSDALSSLSPCTSLPNTFDAASAAASTHFVFSKFGSDVPGIFTIGSHPLQAGTTTCDATTNRPLTTSFITAMPTKDETLEQSKKPEQTIELIPKVERVDSTNSMMGPPQAIPPLKKLNEPNLNMTFPSKASGYELKVLVQPEEQHRARYMTEGSRGAVKDRSQQAFPVVQLKGYNGTATLQVFVGTDTGKVKPHGFYQACKVCGKNSTPCFEKEIDGTNVIEIELDPKEDFKASIDCVGILKLRNADVEQRIGLARSKKKSTRARLVFRVNLPKDDGFTTIQVASSPIACTQPAGLPEICKKSLDEGPMQGGVDMFIIGKNFSKGTQVKVTEKIGDVMVWEKNAEIDQEYFQPTHIICTMPEYRLPSFEKDVQVEITVHASGRASEPSLFNYKPVQPKAVLEEEDIPMDTTEPYVSPVAVQLNKLFQEATPKNGTLENNTIPGKLLKVGTPIQKSASTENLELNAFTKTEPKPTTDEQSIEESLEQLQTLIHDKSGGDQQFQLSSASQQQLKSLLHYMDQHLATNKNNKRDHAAISSMSSDTRMPSQESVATPSVAVVQPQPTQESLQNILLQNATAYKDMEGRAPLRVQGSTAKHTLLEQLLNQLDQQNKTSQQQALKQEKSDVPQVEANPIQIHTQQTVQSQIPQLQQAQLQELINQQQALQQRQQQQVLNNQQQVLNSLQQQPQVLNSLQQQPQVLNSLQQQPQVLNSLQQQPQVLNSLQQQPQVLNSLPQQPQVLNSQGGFTITLADLLKIANPKAIQVNVTTQSQQSVGIISTDDNAPKHKTTPAVLTYMPKAVTPTRIESQNQDISAPTLTNRIIQSHPMSMMSLPTTTHTNSESGLISITSTQVQSNHQQMTALQRSLQEQQPLVTSTVTSLQQPLLVQQDENACTMMDISSSPDQQDLSSIKNDSSIITGDPKCPPDSVRNLVSQADLLLQINGAEVAEAARNELPNITFEDVNQLLECSGVQVADMLKQANTSGEGPGNFAMQFTS